MICIKHPTQWRGPYVPLRPPFAWKRRRYTESGPVPVRGTPSGARDRDRLDAHQAGTGSGRLQ
ncbi:hypothetical protein LMG29660_03391 [Burkholderia puraquae]|uniref:Uncharacterized protein n=1 Tax=Burkholderia puraquae TaxID=1904757 RepID=A0A6J5DZC1_9BURK|nr:hypothetical protein LMG29660_03391 [Burkholderia puraquae]